MMWLEKFPVNKHMLKKEHASHEETVRKIHNRDSKIPLPFLSLSPAGLQILAPS